MQFHENLAPGQRWALLDCDDVLLDWVGGFRDYVNRAHKMGVKGVPDSWDLTRWTGLDKIKTRGLVNSFNETDTGFERLKPVDGARKSLQIMKNLGFNTAIITSSSVSPKSVERRARNISSAFGDLIDRLHIVPLGDSKRAELEKYQNAVWVEDNPDNALLGASVGHRSFLLRAGHNTHMHGNSADGVHHASDWNELLPEIVRLVPDLREAIGVREASFRALERASEAVEHGSWTPRNPESDAMKRLADCGVVKLTRHPNRKTTAELTSVGLIALGISIERKPEPEAPEYDI